MINDNRGMEADHSVKLGRLSAHRTTTNDGSRVELSGPYKFTRACYPDRERRNTLIRDMRVEPELGRDETAERLAKMQAFNEGCNVQERERPNTVPRPKPRKGKEWMEYSEEDIPAL